MPHKNMDTDTDLHNDVKGKVEQQVADANGQQVGGKVVGSLYEAIGGSTESEQQNDVIIYFILYERIYIVFT